MNKNITTATLQLIMLLLFTSCNKTHSKDENSINCKINGKNFSAVTRIELFGSPQILAQNVPIQGFELWGSNHGDPQDPINKYIQISLSYLHHGGIYALNQFNTGMLHIDDTTGINYITNQTSIGSIFISVFDTVNHHFSGTFSFNAIDNKSGNMINITDGFFNVNK